MTKQTWRRMAFVGLLAGGIVLYRLLSEPQQAHDAFRPPALPFRAISLTHDDSERSSGRALAATSAAAPRVRHSVVDDGQVAQTELDDILKDDSGLTARLADLRKHDPALALEMTESVLERDPNHPDVPERTWIVVRALVDLKRREEAKREAGELVRRFPKDRWALDAERHLLVQP